MKRILALILSVTMIFVLVACNSSSNTSSNIDTSGQSQIVSSEYETSELTDSEDTETTDTEASSDGETDTPSTRPQSTQRPSNSITNSNGSTNSKPSTSTSKPSSNNTANNNSNNTNNNSTTTTPTESPYFVKLEYVSRTYAYPYYVDEVNLVNRLYGDKYMQTNDTVTYRVVMSDGGSAGFEISQEIGADVTVKGNLVTITADGSDTEAGFRMKTKDKSGNNTVELLVYSVIKEDSCIVDSETGMYIHLRDYALSKGLKYYNGNELTGYTAKDETLSITNYNKKGADDCVNIKADIVNQQWVFGNNNWVKEVLWVIDEYARMGFTKWSFDVIYLDGFQSMAE